MFLALGAAGATNDTLAIPKQNETVIVVRPAQWASSLIDWKAYRAAQGHRIVEVDAELGPAGIHAAIVRLTTEATEQRRSDSRASTVGYVMLVGDGNRGSQLPPAIPAWYRQSTAMVKLGGDIELATDNPYADIDGDERPDLAIGRVPADSPQAARDYLARVIAYEQQPNFGLWRRDVRVVAGVGGFGAIADSVIEMTTGRFLTDRVPSWANVAMTYASPHSPYCPDPYRFSDATVDQLNAGSTFWVYVGHGNVKHLDFLQVDRDVLGIFSDAQIAHVHTNAGSPIAIFLACYTGAFDAREDCLSEQLVMCPQGPVASLAATRITGPYGLASLASGLLDECYVEHVESLGKAVLHAKQKMLLPTPTDQPVAGPANTQMHLITAIASTLSPAGHDLLAERKEHVWQMNLLGDPLLRLHHPTPLDLSVTPRVAPGDTIAIRGVANQSGRLLVELAPPRDKTPRELFVAGKFSANSVIRDKMHQSYSQANHRSILTQSIDLAAPGPFTYELTTEADMPPGRYVVRLFIEGASACSVGAANVTVRALQNN